MRASNNDIVNFEGPKVTVPNTGVGTSLLNGYRCIYSLELEQIEISTLNSVDSFGFMTWTLTENGVGIWPYINRRCALTSGGYGLIVPCTHKFRALSVADIVATLAGAAGAVDTVARIVGQNKVDVGPGFPPGMFDDLVLNPVDYHKPKQR